MAAPTKTPHRWVTEPGLLWMAPGTEASGAFLKHVLEERLVRWRHNPTGEPAAHGRLVCMRQQRAAELTKCWAFLLVKKDGVIRNYVNQRIVHDMHACVLSRF